MKTLAKLEDEIPVTKEGLDIYIRELEKVYKPIRLQANRMEDLLKKAKERRLKMKTPSKLLPNRNIRRVDSTSGNATFKPWEEKA